jgi:hypothetical protein
MAINSRNAKMELYSLAPLSTLMISRWRNQEESLYKRENLNTIIITYLISQRPSTLK